MFFIQLYYHHPCFVDDVMSFSLALGFIKQLLRIISVSITDDKAGKTVWWVVAF